MKNHRLWVVGLLSIFVMIAFSACQGGKMFRSHFGDDTEKAAYRIQYGVEKMTRTLDLDDGQQAQLRSMAETLHARVVEMRKDREKGKAEVIELVSREKIEAREIDEFLARKMEQIAPVRRLFAENLAGFHAMLTPEQRQKLVAEIKNHEHGQCRFGGKW